MICQTPGCAGACGAYGCALRAKGLRVSSAATPTRRADRRHVAPRRPDPAWERGVAGEHRPDGSFMPLLSPEGGRMGVKEYGETRRAVDARVKQLKTNPHVFQKGSN